MGFLDDAIREHLELKRRRGADPGEIERAEREALGPVRRYEPSDEPGAQQESLSEEHVIYDDEEEDWSEPAPDAPRAGGRVAPSDFEDLDEPESEWETEEPFAEDDRAATQPALPTQGLDPEEAETSEYDVTAEGGPEDEDEDVLEETPDFLQDTPDHDRLWFEQRPPRDFDFDG